MTATANFNLPAADGSSLNLSIDPTGLLIQLQVLKTDGVTVAAQFDLNFTNASNISSQIQKISSFASGAISAVNAIQKSPIQTAQAAQQTLNLVQ